MARRFNSGPGSVLVLGRNLKIKIVSVLKEHKNNEKEIRITTPSTKRGIGTDNTERRLRLIYVTRGNI